VRVRTRAAILTATAYALAADRLATVPGIAASAGVSRTTLHRCFADRETLVNEATLDSIRIFAETVDEAALEHGPTAEATRAVRSPSARCKRCTPDLEAAISIRRRSVWRLGRNVYQ